jgi:hypothetical protein
VRLWSSSSLLVAILVEKKYLRRFISFDHRIDLSIVSCKKLIREGC